MTELAEVLQAFDEQTRRDLVWRAPGVEIQRVERDGVLRVVRFVSEPGQGWSAVIWSDLADLDGAEVDAVIGEQAEFFAGRGATMEWKLYSHDLPSDLPERLARAGFTADPPEALVVAPVADLAREVALPAGVTLVRVTDDTGLAQVRSVVEQAFPEDVDDLATNGFYDALSVQLRETPELLAVVVALAGEEPVSEGRIDFPPSGEFAGLWGGGTVPGWRGRGIYRALVAFRAALAAERGYRYLTVDASPDSRPILERLGFTVLSTTTPYLRRVPAER